MSRIFTHWSWGRIWAIRRTSSGFQRDFKSVVGTLYSKQQLHTSAAVSGKVFLERENAHSYQILSSSSNYKLCPEISFKWGKDSLSDENIAKLLDDPPATPQEICSTLRAVIGYCNKNALAIADERFDKFVDAFTSICDQLTDDQLQSCLTVLQFLPEPPGINSRNFMELWKALDDACKARIQDWSTDKILLIADCWYRLNLVKCSEFVWDGIKKIGRKARKLSPSQLVQSMFLCNLVRRPLVDMFDFEMHLDSMFDSLSLDEVGVMCAGFFKTQTKLHNPQLIEKIYKRLIANLDVVDDITLVNYIKTLRYSSRLPQADIMYGLLDKMCPQLHRISLLACLHVALTGCDIQMCHEKCVEMVLERFHRDIDEARIKDMERICHVMGLFNIKTKSGIKDELCEQILERMQTRIDEIIRYPKCLQTCLHYLTLCGHYNEDMLNAALDQQFIKHVYGKNKLLGREVFCLDSYARINLKDSYRGNLLLDRQRGTMGKMFTHYIPEKNSKFKLNVTDRILVEVNETCKNLWGTSNIKHVLPHFERPDIVIAYDIENRKGLPLSKLCPEDYSGAILNKDDISGGSDKRIEVAAVIIGGWNNFVRNTNMPTGLLEMKMNQLKILGYKVALIPWHEWREQETTADRQKYVRRKVSSMLEVGR
ncbi:unnamed protein product [Hermetia illucens]|uniref:RAP domain-containing protein n=1 Tax=Hermetia illucens TaxID=343691 RepID=A0A7R8V072_HERIL|nr:FAST kinase domain-containing protein 5, mitochondrial [Hermetia illucens]CAD7089811.1 unnamed protein product [Hermetia illucens]